MPTKSSRRRVVCQAIGRIIDDETFGRDEVANINATTEGIVDPHVPAVVFQLEQGCGGEVFLQVVGTGESVGGGDVRVTVDLRLYEGTSETPEDLDGQDQGSVLVPADSFASTDLYVSNTDEGGDSANIKLVFSNHPV